MNARKRSLLALLSATLLIMSCDVSALVPSQPFPTTVPGAIDVFVAQTAAAAATRTAAWIPLTLTPSLTAFPTQTAADTLTPSATFVFILPTVTPTLAPTLSESGAGPTANPKQFSCLLVSQAPVDGTTFSGGDSFTVKWKLKNMGGNPWIYSSTALDYVKGAKFTTNISIDFGATVPKGGSVTLQVPMKAPASSGQYTTIWTLKVNGQVFCPLRLVIIVQ